MRKTDPFPIPGIMGLEPTHKLDWPAMAAKIVHELLKLEKHERVIISADPYYGGAMLEALRIEIQKAGAFELATILHWTPELTKLRSPSGLQPDTADADAEEQAMHQLFSCADVFIWLMNRFYHERSTIATMQTENVLSNWPGRSIHFHWFHDPSHPDPEHPVNKQLDLLYQHAVLELDYTDLKNTMEDLSGKMSNEVIRVQDPAGTDLTFKLGQKFHCNYGDASRARISTVTNARDREEEIPCGSLRSIPLSGSANGVLAFKKDFGFPAHGYGMDINPFISEGLRVYFEDGCITRLETDGDQESLNALWDRETGDKDQLGEFVLGCNPLLKPVEGSRFQPYYGFGEGVIRITLGENWESGGEYRSSFHRWTILTNASLSVGSDTVVNNGAFT